MPEYKFVSFGDNNSSNATKAARSHAIRTALHRRSASASSPSRQSPDDASLRTRPTDATKAQSALKGRFRVSVSTQDNAVPGTPEQKQKDISKWALTSKDKVVSRAASNLKAKPPQSPSEVAMSPILRLKDNYLDPFESLPIPSNPAADTLIQFFLKGFNLNLSALDTQGPWLPYAMQNPLVLRATVALAAGFWSASLPTLDVRLRREGYFQKGETMRLIRKSLGAPSTKRTGEDVYVLAAVATLANVEAFNGEFPAADVHLRGLYDMVQARGGIATIQHDYILCRCISWVDVQVATGIGRMPMFPLFHTLDQVILPSKVLAQAAPPALVYLETADPDAKEDMAAVRAIFMLLRQSIAAQQSKIPVAVASIRVLMSTADVRMLDYLFTDRGTQHIHGDPTSTTCVPDVNAPLVLNQRIGGKSSATALVLAAHVFLYAILRHVPTTSQLLRILTCRLRRFLEGEALEELTTQSTALVVDAWDGHVALLVWISFVGVVGSGWTPMNADNAQWFRLLFHAAVRRALDEEVLASADDVDALEAMLETFLWNETDCGATLESLQQSRPDP